ncbi:BatA domain-containing protein [Aquisphaera insulae]|uniref:BatA domain-containing protein n=1 Tax=Aquisphaera insulae TaxID=2712864 RepID=UPI0013EBCA5A|nr:BatA domain-containing protein [Aquisphaera insulae]
MSFLTPLYLLGALAIAAPIVLHLIRRTTRGETPFSSLMFLEPSPPRLTRRSRLDQWFLLLLRAAALALLAFAFARPFLREPAAMSLGQGDRRIALLIDTSASMKRADLWSRAKAAAAGVIDGCLPGDQLAVIAFDGSPRTLLGFDESAKLDPTRRGVVARSLVGQLAPGWRATNLGRALIHAAAEIEDAGDAKGDTAKLGRRIVLVSDLQQGSDLDALGNFEWPREVELELKPVASDGSNAGLSPIIGRDPVDAKEGEAGNELRVRVTNDAGSRKENFSLTWADGKGQPVPAYVPPGESRVVRVPRPAGSPAGRELRLGGDTDDFDNTLFLAGETRQPAVVLFLGRDRPDDPSGLLYYLKRAFEGTSRRPVTAEARPPDAPLTIPPGPSIPLIVAAAETSPENAGRLRAFANDGGTVLAVAGAAGTVPTLAALADAPDLVVEDAPTKGDAMLTEIAFDHPLFAPFSSPQFNDFTKIRFWKHRRLAADGLKGARILARFEGGDPAIVEQAVGKGRLVIMTSGWTPADSQLARSSKFLPLMEGLLSGPNVDPAFSPQRLVGDRIPLPEGSGSVRKPDGSAATLAAGASSFDGTDAPGVYAIETARGPLEFAVNVDPAESRTAPLDAETLERLGCRLAKDGANVEPDRESMRQLQVEELEGRQKLWRPLILAVLAILIVETWLGGWRGRPRANHAEDHGS